MSDINVNVPAARSAVCALSNQVGVTVTLSSLISMTLGCVGLLGGTRIAAAAVELLNGSNNSVAVVENNIQRLISTVNSALDAYEAADSELQQKILKQSGSLKSLLEKLFSDGFALWQGNSGDIPIGPALLGFTASLAGSFLGLEGKIKNKAKFSLEDGEVSIEGSAGLKAYLAKGNVAIKNGLSKTEIEAFLGEAGVKAKAKGILFENGEFNPSVEAEVKAEANMLSGSIKNQTGTDDVNIHSSASGSVGYAEASAGVSVSKDGVNVSASAEASLFKGEAKSGFTLFGIDIDVGVEGKAFSIGGEASCNATGQSASAKIGGSLGLGFGLSINIDWSKAKFPSWEDIY